VVTAISSILPLGCSGDEPVEQDLGHDELVDVTAPPADGPKLFITADLTIVRDRPSLKGKALGALRIGARVARSEEPYSTHGCAGGWYPIFPRGFVCAGDAATTDAESQHARVMHKQANLDKPLPYLYGRVRAGAAVSYGMLPTYQQQLAAEPKLANRPGKEVERLGVGANDVPLDEQGRPAGLPFVDPAGDGVGEDGYRTSSSYFAFRGQQTPSITPGTTLLRDPRDAETTKVLTRGSGVALVGAIMTGSGKQARQFGITPEGRFVPTDRLRAGLSSAWHGIPLDEIGLPVVFAIRRGVALYQMKNGTAHRTDREYEPREPIPITGRFRTRGGVKYLFARDDGWIRAKDVIQVFKRHKFPDWATAQQKWLDISLANQTLVAYSGHKPLYATLISTGKDRLGDPENGPSTIQGVFRLRSKFVTRGIDEREVSQRFTPLEVPWVAEFEEGFALTASYWQSRFGEGRGYHNVALAPIDAHWLWQWMAPEVPTGWHSVFIDPESTGENTIVYVHK